MVKENLRKLRALNATREMMQKAAADNGVEVKEKGWNGKLVTRKYKYQYAVYLRCQELSGYLKIAIFLTKDMKDGIDTPRFELFINPDGDEYITREFVNGEEKWRKAMIENLDYDRWNGWRYLYSDSQKVDWINAEGAKTIRNKLKVEKSGFRGILEYQRRIMKEKREEGYRREVAPWDADMALIPEVPDGFANWMQKKGVEEHFIFYHYDLKKEAETGYCSYCEKQVPVIKPRHNKKVKCPCCKTEITLKADGKIKRLETKYYDIKLIQKIPGGFVVRSFEVKKKYSDTTFDKPYYIVNEFRRVLYREAGVTLYCMELYKNKEYRWVRQKTYWGIGHYYEYGSSKRGLTYPSNIGRLAQKELRHSGLPIMLKKKPRMDVEKYLRTEAGNPAIEKLVKIGMFRMAEEIMNCSYDKDLLNEEATDLAKMLKLDKNRLNRLKNMDGGIDHMRWLQLEKKNNTSYADDMIRYFADANLVPGNLKFISKMMSYQKIWNYLMRQQGLTKDKPSQIVTTWEDYLNMATKAKMPIDNEQIYKPKNLSEKHAEVIELLQQESFKEKAKEVRKRFKDVDKICAELTKYEYKQGKYCIVAPKDVEDIIREGTILQHCVHTCDFYWDRICQRETYLLFLRRAESPDVPYYTLEVEPTGNIRQKRTTGDNQNKDFDEAIGFLKKWQKEIQKRLSKEDKELGKRANELRIKEYEKLRKDGNKVWHGKLAGKLLVDVLEEDFMEVMNG